MAAFQVITEALCIEPDVNVTVNFPATVPVNIVADLIGMIHSA